MANRRGTIWLTGNTLYPSCGTQDNSGRHEYQSSDDVTFGFLIQVRSDVNATKGIAVKLTVLASLKVPRYLQPKPQFLQDTERLKLSKPIAPWWTIGRVLTYASFSIVATNSLTASTLFWNAAFSSAVKVSSTIFSTPEDPRITGTPT
jgi:hypothetical protein